MNNNLEFQKYIQLGIAGILNMGNCVLCGSHPVWAGIISTETSPVVNPHNLIFFGLCQHCRQDHNWESKVSQVISKSFVSKFQTKSEVRPLIDGETLEI